MERYFVVQWAHMSVKCSESQCLLYSACMEEKAKDCTRCFVKELKLEMKTLSKIGEKYILRKNTREECEESYICS